MGSWLHQTVAVTWLNLRTVQRRLGASAVAIVGIAAVVVVLVAVLSIATGFQAVMRGTGSPQRALVLRSGANSEMVSGLDGRAVNVIGQAPGLAADHRTSLASADLYVLIDIPKRSTGTTANVPMRGIEPVGLRVRDEMSIVDGRMFRFGTNEIIVGRAAVKQFTGLEIGSHVHSGRQTWMVVGVFEAGGGVPEAELWADARILQGVYRRGNTFQSVLARLESTEAFETFKQWLSSNPQLNVQVRRETDYYAEQSEALSTLIRTIGYAIGLLMGVGAVFGAILTMYTAVASRSREIATLRALGFNATSIVISVLVESLVLGTIGGAIGGVVAYVGFNGIETSTMNFQSFSQVAFAFRVTPELLAGGFMYALALGLLGGVLPAIRAARLPIPSALREL
jgi:putative ABC transport system permease protein